MKSSAAKTSEMNKSEKAKKISTALNTSLFLLSGIDLLSSAKLYFGVFVILVGVLNALSLFKSFTEKIQLLIHLANIAVAFLVAFNYYQSGSEYIHWVWIGIALLYTLVLVVFFRKKRLNRSTNE